MYNGGGQLIFERGLQLKFETYIYDLFGNLFCQIVFDFQ